MKSNAYHYGRRVKPINRDTQKLDTLYFIFLFTLFVIMLYVKSCGTLSKLYFTLYILDIGTK